MTPLRSHGLWFGLVMGALLQVTAQAEVRLHSLFSDHMVLQRNASVPVWGWAAEGERVEVSFRRQKVTTVAKGGQWMVRLSPLTAGGPDELRVKGSNEVVIKDVLVGEVWIASGQSNMEWPMRASYEPQTEIAKTTQPQLRLYTVPKLKALEPTNNVPSSWALCNPETTPNFSAVAYYFGRDLQRALGVPVGIIHTSWGGSPAEVWMSQAALAKNPRYAKEILDAYPAAVKRHQEAVAAWEKDKEAAAKAGTEFKRNRPNPPFWRPTELYNGMIAPLIPYAIQGAIWYQGESNAERADQYRSLFADMIRNWREDWKLKDLSFHLVQLAPFKDPKPEPADSSWAELREAQWLATKTLPRVGMAVITDVGDAKDIHPKKKEPVGARLALAARKLTYGERIVHSGPEYRSMRRKGNEIVLSFNHVGQGLVAQGGELKGFAIAGEDRKFVWADARIEGNRVIVSSPKVNQPVAVRYGWADFPLVNLWNADGLPATPFRTDTFPMITAPRP